ncbi:hypothetical protein MY535_06290 [Haemophilus influenzae]|nr:hypothetical protein [Haemophilus influenzae]
MNLFASALPDILMLEFSTPSAGELSSLLESEILRQKIAPLRGNLINALKLLIALNND